MPRIKKVEHTYQIRKRPRLNKEFIDYDKQVPDVNLMMIAEIQELCRQLLDIVGHDIPLTCNKHDESYYYQEWYKKIAEKRKGETR